MVLGIDPGPKTSGVVVLDVRSWPPAVLSANQTTDDPLHLMPPWMDRRDEWVVVVEWLTSYGAAIGAEVLDTARAVGRLEERARRYGVATHLVTRTDVKLELTQSRRSKEAQVCEAIRQIYRDAGKANGGGADPCRGTKAQPGPLFGVAGHAWDALAVALAWIRIDEREGRRLEVGDADAD